MGVSDYCQATDENHEHATSATDSCPLRCIHVIELMAPSGAMQASTCLYDNTLDAAGQRLCGYLTRGTDSFGRSALTTLRETCHIKTGGTAFPSPKYAVPFGTSKGKSSGND